MDFYKFVRGLFSIIIKIFFRVEVKGIENIPDEGKYILASNHKSNWDPLIMATIVKNRKIIGVAKKELFKNYFLNKILTKLEVIPIDRSKPGLSTIKAIIKSIRKGNLLGIYPEGTRIKEEHKFGVAKPGFIMFSMKTKADIIPICVISKYKIFSKIKVVVGKPIIMEKYYSNKIPTSQYQEIADGVMDEIKQLYFNEIDIKKIEQN